MEEYECGGGWQPLIDEALSAMKKYNREHSDDIPIEPVQIKEKFGGLRIYLNHYPENFPDIIQNLECKSYTICEKCDAPAERFSKNHWIYTLCDKCKSKL